MNNSEEFEWCGTLWTYKMEGGRLIHPDTPYQYYDMDNTIMVNKEGELEFTVKHLLKAVSHWDGKVYYPSHAVPTLRSVSPFTYGRFSIECKLPKGINLWPAIWLTGSQRWPPEIDIMEGWTNKKRTYLKWNNPHFPYIFPVYNCTTNIHYTDRDEQKNAIGSKEVSVFKMKCPENNFIKYECEWTPNNISIFYDGKLVRKVTDKEILEHFNKFPQMKFIMDLWVSQKTNVSIDQKMFLRNFKYEKYE